MSKMKESKKKLGDERLLLKEDKDDKKIFELEGRTYLVVAKRWGILLLVSIILFLDIFSSTFFSFVNDVTTKYFRTSPALTDLLSTITMVSRGMFAFVIAILSSRLTFRVTTLGAAGAVFTGSLMIAVGVSSRNNFFTVVLGQIVCGWGTTTALTFSQMATTNWFPKTERGKAVAFPWLIRRLSMVLGSVISTGTLGSAGTPSNGTATGKISKELTDVFRIRYTGVFLTLSVIAFITFCISEAVVTDHPPEVGADMELITKPKRKLSWDPWIQIKGIAKLFLNISFLLALLFYFLILANRPLYDVLLSSIVLKSFPTLDDKFVSTMFSVGLAIGAFGGPICGLILDRFQRPRITFLIGLLGMMLSCILYSLALYLSNTIVLYISNIAMAVWRDFTLVGVQHALVASMQNKEASMRVKAFSLSAAIPWMLVSVYTIAIRKTLNATGPSIAVLFPVPFQILCGLIWLLSWKMFYANE